MGEFKGFLIDLAGVIHNKDELIKGAKETIALLKDNGYKYKFMSNTTQKRRKTIANKLRKLGLDIKEEDIFTPPIAAINFLLQKPDPRCFLLSIGDIDEEFKEHGIILAEDEVDYVIIGDASENFKYNKINQAFRLILEGADIIALEKDKYWMGSDGYMLSAGPFVVGLEYATGKEAMVMGKPANTLFEMGLKDLNLKSNEVAMIGDDIYTDILGAQKSSIKTILVKTGKYDEKILKESGIEPDFLLDSIAAIESLL